eukprot:gene9907-7774_t
MNMKSAMSRNALPSGAPAARVPVGIRSRMSVMPRARGHNVEVVAEKARQFNDGRRIYACSVDMHAERTALLWSVFQVGLADLESVLRTSEVLKLQIEKERARSREITRELDANGRNYNDAGYRQAEQIRKQRIQAQDACLEAVMALEGEKRRIENILAESGSSSDVVESERRARACAEKVAMELEAKIRAASSALAAASQGVSSSGSGSASSELGQAEDAMEAAQRLHTIMKQQLTGEIKRGADAKELASKRARELKQTAEKLRDLEKTRKMLYSQIDDLAKQASAEPGPSAPSSSGAPVSATEKDLLIAAKKISQRVADAERRKEGFQHTKELLAKQNDIFKNVMSDASKLDSITSSLDRNQVIAEGQKASAAKRGLPSFTIHVKNQRQNRELSLRKAVIAEGRKVSSANRDLASSTNHIKNLRKNKELLQQEMALKEKALSATESVKRAIQDEKMNHERIIREAGPALQMLETARTSETKVVALADELDNKLRAAKDRLEKQRNAPAAPVRASPAPAASSSSYSGGAYEAQLAEAETTISMLTKRVAAECARVGHAKDLALTIQKDLGQASGKLRDCEYRLKMMSKAAKNAIIAAEEGQRQLSAFSASSSAPSSSAPSQADPALVQKVQEQTRLADELEAEVQSLEQEIHGLKAGAAAIARNVDTSVSGSMSSWVS